MTARSALPAAPLFLFQIPEDKTMFDPRKPAATQRLSTRRPRPAAVALATVEHALARAQGEADRIADQPPDYVGRMSKRVLAGHEFHDREPGQPLAADRGGNQVRQLLEPKAARRRCVHRRAD